MKKINLQKRCYICKKRFTKDNKKVRDHCHFTGGAAHNQCNMNYKITKDIPVVFHNGFIYDNHFIIKKLVNEFEGKFECSGENTEKYITFSVKISKKITKKDGGEKIVNIPYMLKFIDSDRFMSTSLSSLVDNLSDGLHKCKNCESGLEYIDAKDSKIIFRCLCCNKNCSKDFDKELM